MDGATAAHRKAATISFMTASVVVALVVKVLLDSGASVATGNVSRILSMDLVRHGLPVIAGLVTFIVFQVNKGIKTWSDEVVTEISRVIWPSRDETSRMTMVTIIVVVLSGLALGAVDLVSAKFVEWLIGLDIIGFFSRMF